MAKMMTPHPRKISIGSNTNGPERLIMAQKGFTMMEVAIALAIMAIVAAFAAPQMMEWNAVRKVTKDARDFYTNMQLTKLAAIKEDGNAVVTINIGAGTYQSFVDDGRPTGVGIDNNVLDAGELVVSTGRIHGNTTMLIPPGEFAAGPPGFTSRGFSLRSTTGTVVFTGGGARSPILWQRARMLTTGHLVFEVSSNSTDGVNGQWDMR